MNYRYILCHNASEKEEAGDISPTWYSALTYTAIVRKAESESPWWDDEYDFGGNICMSCQKAVHNLCVADGLCLYCHWELHTAYIMSRKLMVIGKFALFL